ncbi:hypothetical protein K7432_004398 [Basidiobolus ranarum]|uniref:Uncharacterized protein n=1 Tax=Basidiobolus ranarum TaxID=34480 RepID=A0ABR2WY92_9FUNG
MSAITVTPDVIFQSNVNIMIAAIAIPIGLSNTIMSIKMLRKDKAFIFKLNLGQSVILLLSKIIQSVLILMNNQNCSFGILLAAITYYVSTMLIEVILITKAYYANMCSKTIAACGASIEVARLVVHVIILFYIQPVVTSLGSCFSLGTDLLFMLLVSAEGCLVIFLSGAFIGSLLRVSRIQTGGVYDALIKDGVIYVFSICIVIAVILLLILIGVAPAINGYFLDLGWALSSKLMTEQLWNSHHRRKERTQTFSPNSTHQTYNERGGKSYAHSLQSLTRDEANDNICLDSINTISVKPSFT